MKKIYLSLYAMLLFTTIIFAQTTVLLTPTNATNWTGSVVTAGTVTTPDITGVSSTTGRGFSRFDLSSIPSGALISAATMRITTSTGTVSSGVANFVTVSNSDPLVVTGAALYTALGAGAVANNVSWAGTAPTTLNLVFTGAGISALSSLATGLPSAFVTIGLIRASTNNYNITGSNGTGATIPQLTITYTVPTAPPACATGLVPANAATGVAVTGAISWTATPNAASYDIFLGKTANPPLLGNVTGTSATITAGLDLNTLYYWKVVPKNPIGSAIGCTEQTFTTSSTPATTCVTGLYPTGASVGCTLGDAISNVTFVNINNNTTCSASPYYTLYSTPIASPVPVGSGTSISITTGDPDDRAKVWIDLNDNGIFGNDELFFNEKGSNLSGSITLPSTAPLGNHKMRVRIVWMSNPTTQPEQNFTACSLQTYGEVEDYVINVTAAASCVNPTGLLATTVTTNSASLNWNAIPGAVGYVYSFGTTNTPPTNPTTATPTIATTYATSGLAQLTTYYMHVATDCGGTYSSWSTTSFTTPIDCAIAPVLSCGGTPTAAVFPAGAGVWNFAGTNPTNSCGAATAGLEKIYKFTANFTGVHIINVTTAATGSSVDFLIKESSGGCSPTGFTCVGSTLSLPTGTGNLSTPSLTAGTEYFIVADPQLSTGSTVSFIISCPTICPAPTAVSVSSITTNSASITWTGSGTNILEYGLTGFTPGTGATAGVGGTVINPAISPQAITGLTTGTAYQVYVRQDCTGASNGYSPNSNVNTFTTLPPPPANDACANATTLVCNAAAIIGTTLSTVSETSPGCGSNYGVWYTFVGDGTTVTITSTTTFDHSIAVYTGSCGALTEQSCTDNSTGTETNTFTSVNGTTYYVYIAHWDAVSTTTGTFTIGIACISCAAPTAVGTNTITSNSANVTWTGTGTFILEYGLTGFTPGTGATAGAGGTVINPATSAQAISGLTGSTAYQVYVRKDCTGAGSGYSLNSTVAAFTTLGAPPANDNAPGAITLTVGGACAGNPYDNTNGTQSATEPFPSCEGTAGYAGMWYKFVAPASGSVRISCDGTGTFGDSRMALYSATNPNDYTTFSIIACDDDNGFVTSARSLFYATGLTVGTTYYVLVDLYSTFSTKGTYCVAVDELASTMLSSTAANCVSDQGYSGLNTTYTGWISLVDAAGLLNANVRQTAGTATSFSSSATVTTGASRLDGLGQAYLNRNFLISGTGATSADVQLFFLNSEVTTLGGTIAGYNVTRVAGATCNANFTGVGSLLTQTANGTANGVSYIQVTTPGFSNFYIQNSLTVLPISIESFKGKKQGSANYLDWKVTCTNEPSLTLTLERGADGRNFKTINDQNATATRCLQGFDYTDALPLGGANYYRLKVTSTTGKVYYSTIVVLLNKEKGFELISVAPNPTKNIAILTLTSVKAGNMSIIITDLIGKVVAKQTVNVIAGNNPIDMNFATLGAGTYTIAATNAEGEVKTTRFVKY